MNSLKKLFGWFIFLLVVLSVLRLFLFEVAMTASYAMVPNLVPGDVFLVYKRATLGPGDIAVCRDPENPASNVVARIMGVPGSTLAIRQNRLMINNDLIDIQFSEPIIYQDKSSEEKFEYVVEIGNSFIGGHAVKFALMKRGSNRNFSRHEVKYGFFLLGDNRNIARDSRQYGEVPVEDCIGKAALILWPAADNGDIKRNDRFLKFL